MKKILLFAASVLLSVSVSAHDFEVNGIYYEIIIDESGVAVTFQGSTYSSYNEYTGNVTIPEAVTYSGKTYVVRMIKASAFRNCTGLSSVTIPNTVTQIGNYAFYGCTDLTDVICYATNVPNTNYINSFRNVTLSSATLHVPTASLASYSTTSPWKNFENIVPIEPVSSEGSITASDGHKYVDLGLPSGTLWATCNIGTDSPEGYGDYFAWGETVSYGGEDRSNAMNYSYAGSYTRTYYSFDTYKWCNGTYNTLTKYCDDSNYGYNGFTDTLTILEPKDDAAYVNWGIGWCMPTMEQFQELINPDYTTSKKVTIGGVWGVLIVSKMEGYTDRSIFLPGAGQRWHDSLCQPNEVGVYWFRSMYNDGISLIFPKYTYDVPAEDLFGGRCLGSSVRPVRATSIHLIDGEVYANNTEQDFKRIFYTRTFRNNNWQALYVPFRMNYSDWSTDFDISRINDVHQFDDNDDGTIDRTLLEVIYMPEGNHTTANTPYLIRAKAKATELNPVTPTITLTDAMLYPDDENSFDVSSWTTLFTFTGTYTGVSVGDMLSNGYYAMGGGRLLQSDGTNGLGTYRWYMAVTDRSGMPKDIGEVKLQVIGWDGVEDETGIKGIDNGQWRFDNDSYYDLSGRRIAHPTKGIYIRNGKKIVLR